MIISSARGSACALPRLIILTRAHSQILSDRFPDRELRERYVERERKRDQNRDRKREKER